MTATKSTSSHAGNSFDTLRLIFAVLVIFSHSFDLGRGSDKREPLYVLTHGQITFGNVSVWAFFVISGFLIAQSWTRSPKPLKFMKRRVARIYPGFIVAALLTALIAVPIAADPATRRPIAMGNFLLQTLRLQVFDTSPVFVHNAWPNALNGSLWSVPFEFWCYIGILVLGVTGLLLRRWLVVALFAAVIAWHLYLSITGWMPGGKILGVIFGFPLFWAIVLPFFLAGSLFHLFGGTVLLRKPLHVGGSRASDCVELHPPCADRYSSSLRRVSSAGPRLSAFAAPAESGALRRFFLRHLSLCLPDSAVDCEVRRGNYGSNETLPAGCSALGGNRRPFLVCCGAALPDAEPVTEACDFSRSKRNHGAGFDLENGKEVARH